MYVLCSSQHSSEVYTMSVPTILPYASCKLPLYNPSFVTGMVNVTKGILLTCDPAVKQFLVHLDETGAAGQRLLTLNINNYFYKK